jgi:hypothetical protein
MSLVRRILLAATLGAAAPAALACSSCGCTLSSDWLVQGGQYGGFHADVRLDYFNQDDLRGRTHRIDRGSIELPADEEVQQETINRNYNLFLDYAAPGSDWGFSAQVPYFNRYHTTIAEGDTEVSTSHTKGLGDVRLLARYQGLSDDKSLGLQFGVKRPTGSIHNDFIDAFAGKEHLLPPYPVQNWLTAQFRAAALAAGRTDIVSLWSGQSAPLLKHRRASDLMAALMTAA